MIQIETIFDILWKGFIIGVIVYDAISLKTCVEKRLTTGGPGRQAMLDTIEMQKAYLNTL